MLPSRHIATSLARRARPRLHCPRRYLHLSRPLFAGQGTAGSSSQPATQEAPNPAQPENPASLLASAWKGCRSRSKGGRAAEDAGSPPLSADESLPTTRKSSRKSSPARKTQKDSPPAAEEPAEESAPTEKTSWKSSRTSSSARKTKTDSPPAAEEPAEEPILTENTSQISEDGGPSATTTKTRKSAEEDKPEKKPRKKSENKPKETPETQPKARKPVPAHLSALNNPLVTYLWDHLASRRLLADKSRVNIVSESLCDDAIQRLVPSLQRHMNCDIIDINPGVGLFSSKLHEVVKPRSHLLVEGDYTVYQPYLQPLLEQRGSTYKLLPESGIIFKAQDKIVSPEYLPHQQIYGPEDPRSNQPNNSLLLVVNICNYPAKTYRRYQTISNLVLYQLLSAIRTKSRFQSYGLVRMLLWIPETEKQGLLPKMLSTRKKSAVEAELSCEYIHEIAGPDPDRWTTKSYQRRRDQEIDLESGRQVARRMEELGIETPPGRSISTPLPESSEHGSLTLRPWHRELADLEARLARREIYLWLDDDGNKRYDQRPRYNHGFDQNTPEGLRLRALRSRRLWEMSIHSKHTKSFELYREIQELEEQAFEARHSDGYEALRRETRARREDLIEQVESGGTAKTSSFWTTIDDQHALQQDPPILYWDRRPAEPLVVRPEEFLPQKEMCLVDVQPQAMWPFLLQEDNGEISRAVLAHLYVQPSEPLPKSLNSLAHGAADWIIPECPSLTDPSQGGFRDPKDLRVRCLNQQQLREIVESWVKWPFRPSVSQLIARTLSNGHLDEEEEV